MLNCALRLKEDSDETKPEIVKMANEDTGEMMDPEEEFLCGQ